jgi:predicted nuclease of predicted toxin-antitoxin system
VRFLVDECAGPALANWLREQGHDAASIYDDSPGIGDEQVLDRAVREDRILISVDKDFGEYVFRDLKQHRGVLLLRLADERAANKIATVKRVLDQYIDRLPLRFVVATEGKVRFR